MANERIQFGVDGVGVLSEYDIDRLRHGGIVHVTSDADARTFSAQPTPASRPYRVVGITRPQPEGYRLVALLCDVYVGSNVAPRLLEAIGCVIPRNEIDQRLQVLASEVPFELLHDDGAISNSRVRRIESVLDRLDLITVLGGAGPELWLHYRSLVAYLYLTCFDLMGQDVEWIEFPAWLSSKARRHVDERTSAVATISPGADSVEVAQHLHTAYNATYSVRQGFRRFITEILPADMRRALMASIVAERRGAAPLSTENDPPIVLSENRRIDWLFSQRNQYTHRATYIPGLHDLMIPTDMRGDEDTWCMGEDRTETTITEYSVRRWPKILDECVRAGLLSYMSR